MDIETGSRYRGKRKWPAPDLAGTTVVARCRAPVREQGQTRQKRQSGHALLRTLEATLAAQGAAAPRAVLARGKGVIIALGVALFLVAHGLLALDGRGRGGVGIRRVEREGGTTRGVYARDWRGSGGGCVGDERRGGGGRRERDAGGAGSGADGARRGGAATCTRNL